MFGAANVSTWGFEAVPVTECLVPIEEIGFESVEIWGDTPAHFDPLSKDAVSDLRESLSTVRLKGDSLHAPFGADEDMSSADPQKRSRAIETVLTCLNSARELSISSIVIHPGHLMRPGEEPARYAAAADSLERIRDLAVELGIQVCVENLYSDESHLVFCNTLPKLLHLIRSVEGDPPAICLDTSHGNIMGNVWEDIEICGNAVRRTHISDNFGSSDDHLPPGDGKIDWDSVLTSLHRISYGGPLTLEVAGRDNPKEVLSRARSQFSRIMARWKP